MSETGRVLKPANENPWYVLMTLYGEQEGEEIDEALHEKNRAAWNAWACQSLSVEEQVSAAASVEVALTEVQDWNQQREEIVSRHRTATEARNGAEHYTGLPLIDEQMELSGISFSHIVCCKKFVFPVVSQFKLASFERDAWFDNAMFGDAPTFSGAKFNGHARFDSAKFVGGASFHLAIFDRDSRFSSSQFFGGAIFKSTLFREMAMFDGVMFSGHTSFDLAEFVNKTVFHHAIFVTDVRFISVVFDGDAEFRITTFAGKANFGSTKFNREARFDEAKFQSELTFSKAVFGGLSYFAATKFGVVGVALRATFNDCRFLQSCSFGASEFLSSYPEFSGAVLHDKTTFTAKSQFWPQGKHLDPDQAKATCAAIRHNLGKQGLPEEEHFFFRREMGFAAQIGGWWQRLPYRVFGAISDFGYSIQRPALWLFGLWLGVAMINHVVLQWAASRQGLDYHAVQAFGLSFANQFPVFGLQGRWFSVKFLGDLNPWLKALGGVQTVVSLPLLFFFALGLRTRFRMR
ncbi:MAG: pentapeptide repeat-containing protein [Cypionkella sp.]|uniref:pentapeptide repeat-containing protein n=1 Tax=Cypionkella sp. TaxID=2811411 RepID=UPI002ABABA22|nr:pentapeptide repeat-containing protein [Cypionkella sp.]MDZ4311071.1 pentapeptide repeat-containing protein [Cypionkella sp.]